MILALILKFVIITVVLAVITPFLIMATTFIAGGSVAPGTSERERFWTFVGIWTVLILVYFGFPLLVFLI